MTRWAVINKHCPSYCINDNGKLRWTYDRAKAEIVARRILGEVVDADVFAKDPTGYFKQKESA